MKRIINIIGKLTIALGALLLIGTAGASDANMIEWSDIVRQVIMSGLVIGAGVVLSVATRDEADQ